MSSFRPAGAGSYGSLLPASPALTCPSAPLAGCQVLCAAPGDAVGFECQFANCSGDAAWFTVDASSSSTGSSSSGQINLVTDTEEWQALAPLASLAGEQNTVVLPGWVSTAC